MRHFSIELLRESPFPALRTCARLAQLQVLVTHTFTFLWTAYTPQRAQVESILMKMAILRNENSNVSLQPFVGRELFAAGFVSCWSQLNETSQRQLVRSLEMAFSSPNIPPEILATLLNLVSPTCHLFFSL